MPGTYESAFLYGIIPICQLSPLSAQLHLGVRSFDLRFSIKRGRLRAHHSIQRQRAATKDLFQEFYTFVEGH